MDIIQFPPARVLEINHYILGASPGHQGPASIALLEGALGRIDNAIAYNGLNDVFLAAVAIAMRSKKMKVAPAIPTAPAPPCAAAPLPMQR